MHAAVFHNCASMNRVIADAMYMMSPVNGSNEVHLNGYIYIYEQAPLQARALCNGREASVVVWIDHKTSLKGVIIDILLHREVVAQRQQRQQQQQVYG